METAGGLKGNPFTISFCTFQEMGGKIRNGETYSWAEEMPEAFKQLALLTRDKFVVMGPTTFKAFSNCTYGRNLILSNSKHSCFILTKKKDFSSPKEYPVCAVTSLQKITNIWHTVRKLEKIKHDETRKRLELQRQLLVQTGKISSKEIYEVETERCVEKEIVAIGGPLLYKRIMNYADRIYLFLICEYFSGDTALPPIDQALWEQDPNAYREYSANEENKYTLLRVVWKRKNKPPRILL